MKLGKVTSGLKVGKAGYKFIDYALSQCIVYVISFNSYNSVK